MAIFMARYPGRAKDSLAMLLFLPARFRILPGQRALAEVGGLVQASQHFKLKFFLKGWQTICHRTWVCYRRAVSRSASAAMHFDFEKKSASSKRMSDSATSGKF
jgi:hypothetical protein